MSLSIAMSIRMAAVAPYLSCGWILDHAAEVVEHQWLRHMRCNHHERLRREVPL